MINNMQALIDGMSLEWQRDRAKTQMTLGKMIDALKVMPNNKRIEGLGELSSYRGYYSDLAFEPSKGKKTVAKILKECGAAMGTVFTGYKGGDYVMGANTPLWLACYGLCGKKIIGINTDGVIETIDDD